MQIRCAVKNAVNVERTQNLLSASKFDSVEVSAGCVSRQARDVLVAKVPTKHLVSKWLVLFFLLSSLSFLASYFNSSGWRHVERYFRTKEWRASYTANEKFIVALKTLTSLKEQYCKRENRNRADDSRRRRLSRFHTVSLYGCIFRLRCLFTSYRCKSIPTDSLILRAHCIPRASILTALMICGRIRGLIGQLPVSKPTWLCDACG